MSLWRVPWTCGIRVEHHHLWDSARELSFWAYRVVQDPSDSKSNWLHVDIFRFCCFHSFEVYSSIDSSKMIGDYSKVPNFNRLLMQLSTGSSATSGRFSPFIEGSNFCKINVLFYLLTYTIALSHLQFTTYLKTWHQNCISVIRLLNFSLINTISQTSHEVSIR